MKITEIETIALTDPGKADETLVRVHTDEGITGNWASRISVTGD